MSNIPQIMRRYRLEEEKKKKRKRKYTSSMRRELKVEEQFKEKGITRKVINQMNEVGKKKHFFANDIHEEYRGQDKPADFDDKRRRNRRQRLFNPEYHRQVTAIILESSGTGLTESYCIPRLKVAFDCSSQMPSIMLRLPLNEAETEMVGVHLFGTNLALQEHQSPVTLTTGEKTKCIVENENDLFDETIRGLADAGRLSVMAIKLLCGKDREGRSSRPVFTGVTNGQLEEWGYHLLPENESKPKPVDWSLEKELLAELWLNCRETMWIMWPYTGRDRKTVQEAERCQIQRFGDFFGAAMGLSAELGNFWWFRQQSKELWTSGDFPFKRMVPPRWMITTWSTRSPAPMLWADFSFSWPGIFPGTEEQSFLRRIAAARDHQCDEALAVEDYFTSPG